MEAYSWGKPFWGTKLMRKEMGVKLVLTMLVTIDKVGLALEEEDGMDDAPLEEFIKDSRCYKISMI